MDKQAPQGTKTPDEELADKITDAIGSANLVSADTLDRVRQGLCKGSLSSADWKILVELGAPQKGADPK